MYQIDVPDDRKSIYATMVSDKGGLVVEELSSSFCRADSHSTHGSHEYLLVLSENAGKFFAPVAKNQLHGSLWTGPADRYASRGISVAVDG